MNEQPKRRDDFVVVRDLKVHFPVTRGLLKRTVGYVKAVDGVSFTIPQGETLGIVGESGSGKSTVGNGILRATPYAEGEIIFDGVNYKDVDRAGMRKLRKRIQVVMQDPYSSLDPRMNVRECIAEGVRIHRTMSRADADAKAEELLELVGIMGIGVGFFTGSSPTVIQNHGSLAGYIERLQINWGYLREDVGALLARAGLYL